jgi:DNA mismatch repair protein MutL
VGTEVSVAHGRRRHLRETGHPRGTTVETRDLFGAVPARRKFLRAPSTEAAHVAEAVTLAALARPGVGFFLRSGRRAVIEAPPVHGLTARVEQLFGARRLGELVPVEGGLEWASVSGLVSRPGRVRSQRASLRLFVNHRPVRDRALARAVAEGYRAAGAEERGFEAFVFVDVPLHLVDVNVHPAKTEVRFADTRTVFSAVERAVSEALGRGMREPPAVRVGSGAGEVGARAEAAVSSYLDRVGRSTLSPPVADRVGEGAVPRTLDHAPSPLVLGQHRLTYIVASDGDELILVDQHTAHERVRFEGLLERAPGRPVESQRRLEPLVVELAPALRLVLEAHAPALCELGFEVEAFGGGAARVRATPAILGTRDPGPALERLLSELAEPEAADWAVTGARARVAATLACHSAVRAGEALTREAMTAIVRELLATAHPALCPHGRPTIVRIPRDDVSRWFERSGWRRR